MALNVQVMNERQVLVVAGNYDVILQVQTALRGRGFAVHSAFSHRDATYAMHQGKHDVVLVDMAMRDRRTGKLTLMTLAEQVLRPPLVALMPGEDEYDELDGVDTVITTLDEQSIQRGVLQALRMPVLQLLELPTLEDTIQIDDEEHGLEEIQTLFALSRSLTEVLNLSEVLNRVVEAARSLTNADEGMILLPDSDGGDLYLRARVGIDVEVARNFRIRTQDTLAGSVYSSGKPLLISAQGPQKVKTEYFVNSLLYVPILLRGRPIGVLGVNNRHKNDIFENRHQELLANLASYAAIAMENARIHEDSLKQARDLKALVDASQIINSSIALESTVKNICEQLTRVLNVSRAGIMTWDQQGGRLNALAHYDRAIWKAGHEPTIDLNQRPALRRSIALNKPFVASRKGSRVTGELHTIEPLGAAAMLFLPIQAANASVGALMVYYLRRPEHEPVMEVLQRAQQIGLQAVAHTLNPRRQAAASVMKQMEDVNRLLQSDWVELAVVTPDRQGLTVKVAEGRGLWLTPPYPSLSIDGSDGFQQALESGVPWNCHVGESGSPQALFDHLRCQALLCVPLVSRGQVQGAVLLCDTERSGPFTSREIDLARTVVGQAGTALENARLFHHLQESLKELKDTQERLVQTARLSAMGELAAAVAHQVNNPLTTIVLDAELMLLNEQPGTNRHEVLTAIVRAGKRAASVVRRLLTTARTTDGDGPLQPVDLVETIQDVITLVRGHIERDKMCIIARLPDEPLPPVCAVPGQLDDVWLNLLLNAHDALQGRSNAEMGIDVSYEPGSDGIDIVVWDNGPGIPPEHVDEVFKPFFTTKPVGEGTGLGLHICRQVVERVGGTIVVESSAVEGTQFFVRLPVKRGEKYGSAHLSGR